MVAAGGGVVRALDTEDGIARWCRDVSVNEDGAKGAVLAGGVVYVDGKPIDLPGQVVTPPGCPASTPASRLQLTVARSSGLQHRVEVAVCDADSGKRIWAKTVPGYQAEMIDQTVVVSDQSNGTGVRPSSSQSKLTGYRAADGSVDWQLDLPQSFGLWPAGSGAFLWTTGRDPLTFVNVATHQVSWSVNPGNPGRSRKYRDSDDVRQVIYDPATDGIYVLLVAQEPYRD